MQEQCGFTLVEVLVALVLLEVGLVAVSGMALVAGRMSREARALEWAAGELGQVADSILIRGVAEDGARHNEEGESTWWVEGGPAMPTLGLRVVGDPNGAARTIEAALVLPFGPTAAH